MKPHLIIRRCYLPILTLMISLLSGCMSKKKNFLEKKLFICQTKCSPARTNPDCNTNHITTKTTDHPMVTVWIHGSKGTLRILRKIGAVERFFYTHTGLCALENLDTSMHHRCIGEALIASDPDNYVREHFYLFGWNGKITFESREQAARDLYCSLEELIERYQNNYGYTPKIRIMSHSHGGNVALNLALVKKEFSTPLSIEELILLACPVQDYTECLITDPMFKNIYSFYSSKDFVQIIDPQGSYPSQRNIAKTYFSRRRFVPTQNLTQVKIKINRRPISHIEFMLNRFIRMIPCAVEEVKMWKQNPCVSAETELILSLYTRNYKHPYRLP